MGSGIHVDSDIIEDDPTIVDEFDIDIPQAVANDHAHGELELNWLHASGSATIDDLVGNSNGVGHGSTVTTAQGYVDSSTGRRLGTLPALMITNCCDQTS